MVFKFGRLIAGEKEISQVLHILKQETKPIAIVVSALGRGITDELHKLGKLAASGNESYVEQIKQVELRHMNLVKELIPVAKQSAVLSSTKQTINQLETILDGVFMIRELSAKTQDTLLSFGELLSHNIIAHAARHKDLMQLQKTVKNSLSLRSPSAEL